MWHIDDHAEQEEESGPYIGTSVVGQLSQGKASLKVAGAGEHYYEGGFIKFPAWALHRTGEVAPRGAAREHAVLGSGYPTLLKAA